jgi:membrane fusion protein (multidrug efflux system)
MNQHRPTLIVGVVVAVTVGTLLFYWTYWSARFVNTENAYVEAEFSPVNSRMMGFVKEVLVSESDVVKRGQELLRLDDVDSQLELTFKQAKLKKAQADFARAERLHKEHALSDADLELAEAGLSGIRAETDGSLLKIRFTKILSPIDGIVGKRSAQPGQFVQPGQSLFVIVPTKKTWVKANFKENSIRSIHKGQKAEIKIDAYPGEQWLGTVDFVYPSSVASLSLIPPENATGNFTKVVQRFPVRISLDEKPNFELRPGMSAEVTIDIN